MRCAGGTPRHRRWQKSWIPRQDSPGEEVKLFPDNVRAGVSGRAPDGTAAGAPEPRQFDRSGRSRRDAQHGCGGTG